MRPNTVSSSLSLLLAVVLAASPGAASAAKAPKQAKAAAPAPKSLFEGVQLYQIDTAHSPIGFSIQWMGLSKVNGAFADYSGTMTLDQADLTRSSLTLVIKSQSLTTFNENRDRDLKGPDWFDVAKFPTAVFASREVVKQGEGYLMRGRLTLHGVTKDVEIPFTFIGRLKDLNGVERTGFEGRATLNRKDFGIVGPARYNALLEIGKAVIGDDVDLPLTVEAFRPPVRDTLQDRTADSLWRAVMARGAAAVTKDYRALRGTTPDSLIPVNEQRMNAVGLQLVEKGRAADAIELYKLEAEVYPQSASGPSGMAYAYATLGDRENATANAERALAINPSATRSLEILRRAKAPAVN